MLLWKSVKSCVLVAVDCCSWFSELHVVDAVGDGCCSCIAVLVVLIVDVVIDAAGVVVSVALSHGNMAIADHCSHLRKTCELFHIFQSKQLTVL